MKKVLNKNWRQEHAVKTNCIVFLNRFFNSCHGLLTFQCRCLCVCVCSFFSNIVRIVGCHPFNSFILNRFPRNIQMSFSSLSPLCSLTEFNLCNFPNRFEISQKIFQLWLHAIRNGQYGCKTCDVRWSKRKEHVWNCVYSYDRSSPFKIDEKYMNLRYFLMSKMIRNIFANFLLCFAALVHFDWFPVWRCDQMYDSNRNIMFRTLLKLLKHHYTIKHSYNADQKNVLILFSSQLLYSFISHSFSIDFEFMNSVRMEWK